MPQRWDPSAAVEVMRSAQLEPLEPYVNNRTPWRATCMVCGQQVAPRFEVVRRGGGCGFCAGNVRISAEDAERRAKAQGFEALEPYPGARNPWKCRCLTCGLVGSPRPDDVFRGRGCYGCGLKRRVDARRLDPRIAVRSMQAAGLEPIEPFVNALRPWRCMCMRCRREVTPRYAGVQQGQGGCSFCASNAAVPHPVALKALEDQGLAPLEPFPGSNRPWRCRCITCGADVAPRYTDIKQKAVACRYCSSRRRGVALRKPAREAVAVMISAGLEPLGDYTDNKTPWESRCVRCDRIVRPRYNAISNGQGGCPYCAGNAPVDPQEATAVMVRAGFRPLGSFPGSHSPWPCICERCGRESTPALVNVRAGRSTCRFCAPRGFQYAKPGFVYVITHARLGAHKVGISGHGTGRLEKHQRRGWTVHRTISFELGMHAYLVEQSVLRWLRTELLAPPFGEFDEGWTETVAAEEVQLSALWRRVEVEAERIHASRSGDSDGATAGALDEDALAPGEVTRLLDLE